MKLTKANVSRTLKAAGHAQGRGEQDGFTLSGGYLGTTVIVRGYYPASDPTPDERDAHCQAWAAALAPHFVVERKPSRLLVTEREREDGG